MVASAEIFFYDIARVVSVYLLQGSWSGTQTFPIMPSLQKRGCIDPGDDLFSKNTTAQAESHLSFTHPTPARAS